MKHCKWFTGSFFVIVMCSGIFATSCRNNNETHSLKDEEYQKFLSAHVHTYNLALNKRFIQTTDSFYSTLKNVSTYGLLTKYDHKSVFYFESGLYDSSALYIDSTLKVIESNHLEEKYAAEYVGAMNLKGRVLYATDHFTQAYDLYFKVKQLAEQYKNNCILSDYNYCIGMISYKQKKYNEAASYFKQSFVSTEACNKGGNYRSQENLDNIALSFEKMNLYDSAIFYYDSALSYINRHYSNSPDTIMYGKAVGVVYGNIGSVWLSKGAIDSAIFYLRKGYDINIRRVYENTDALVIHLKLADAYLRKRDFTLTDIALRALGKELDTIKHSQEAECDYSHLLYQYYEQTGNEPEAHKHYLTYTTCRDSLWVTEKKQLQTDIKRELNDKDQSFQIGLLQKQNQLSTAYLWVTIVFLSMAVVIVILIFKNNQKSKKNIKELTALNEQVSKQKTELEKKNKEKDRILQVVAHDLRNPVGGITMLIEMVEMETPGSKDYNDAIVLIKSASQSALSLINELLGYSSDMNGKLAKEPVDIKKLVNESAKLLQFKASEKNQQIHAHLPGSELLIPANKEKITRVMNNLIGNAIKFSPTDSAINVTVEEKDRSVVITIKDSGIGIPAKLQTAVFDMFTSSKRYGTAGEKSFGLGLSICKQIIEAHGGKIWFESTEGEGTTFYVSLPA